MAVQHAVQQRFVWGMKLGVALGEHAVTELHAQLAFQRHVVAGHGALQWGQGRGEVVLSGVPFGQFKLNQPPIGSALGQGLQLGVASLQLAGRHEVARPLQLKDVAFGEVLACLLQELSEVLRICGLLDDAKGFCAHVFVVAHLRFVVAHQVECGKHMAFAEQAVHAFKQRLQIAGPGHDVGRPIFFCAGAISLGQAGQPAVVHHPRVAGFQLRCAVQVKLGRFVALQLKVDFAELEMKGDLLRLGICAGQKAGVGVFQIAFQQVSLALEVGELGLFAVGNVGGVAFAQRRHEAAAAEAQAQGQSQHPSSRCRARQPHARGVPTVQ